MNQFKTLQERRQATSQLIKNEIYQLKERGYNPITGKCVEEILAGINPTTAFIVAFRKACALIKCEDTTLHDIKSAINFFEIAAKKMGIDRLEIQLVKRRHLHQMIEMCAELKGVGAPGAITTAGLT